MKEEAIISADDAIEDRRAIYKAEQAIWTACAICLGWQWKPAYGGYTRPNHVKPGTNGSNFSDYPSEVDAEEACDIDGIDTLGAALKLLEERGLAL